MESLEWLSINISKLELVPHKAPPWSLFAKAPARPLSMCRHQLGIERLPVASPRRCLPDDIVTWKKFVCTVDGFTVSTLVSFRQPFSITRTCVSQDWF